jgi:ABC-2 type transport system permease protein
MAMLCVLVGTITENVANWDGHVQLYGDSASWLVLLLAPPLSAGAVATAGVLVSLHAATVRQAQQTLMVAVLVLVAGSIFASNFLPMAWKEWFFGIWSVWSPASLVLAAAGVVLAFDVLLLLAGMARFQRARLVLD